MSIEALSHLFRTDTAIEGWNQKTAYSLDKSSARYAGWQTYAKTNDLFPVELHPTYRALIDTMHDAGFVDLVELIADAGDDGRVSDYYRSHIRRCIVGFKRPMAEILADNYPG